MASDPTPTSPVEQPSTAAPALLDPAVKRSWMRATRVTIVLTVGAIVISGGIKTLGGGGGYGSLRLFVPDNALAEAVDALEPDELTPKQALEALYRLKQLR